MKNIKKILIGASLIAILSVNAVTGFSIFKNQTNDITTSAYAWSGTQTPNIGSYYNKVSDSLVGNQLKAKLKEINPSMSTSYDWSRYEDADEAEGDSTSILSLYTRHTIKKNSHVGNYSWETWNREHIWTQTAYPNSKADNHNIFACEGKINQIRDNYPFGEVAHSSSTLVKVFDMRLVVI